MSNREQITKLIKKYELHADDVYVHESKQFKVIKRRGYKRIQSKLKIEISFRCPHAGTDFAVVIATGSMWPEGGSHAILRSTIGESNPRNNTFEYPVNVAQKRAEGRLILEMANLYEEGWMGEDEIDVAVKGAKIKAKAEKAGAASTDKTAEILGIKQ